MKWLALSCLLCTVIIICSVLGPKITGELTNQICNYWEAKVSGGALWDLVREMLPGLLALLGVYTLGAGVRYGNMLLMNRMVSRHYTCAIRIRMSDKIQRLPVKFVDSTPVGQILEQMTDDVFCHGQFHSSDCGHPDAGGCCRLCSSRRRFWQRIGGWD